MFNDIYLVNSAYFQLLKSSLENMAGKIDISSIKYQLDAVEKTFLPNQSDYCAVSQYINQYIKEIQQSYKQAVDLLLQIERDKKANRRYAAIMMEIDWPPVLDIPSAAIYEIINLYDSMPIEEFRREIDSSLIEFYDQDELSQILEEWKTIKILERRIGILEDIIIGHNLGKFNLTIPTALSQIEGILGDIYNHLGKMKGLHRDNYLTELFNHYIFNLPELSAVPLIWKVYEGFEWGKPVPSHINRHAILHGFNTDYGYRINSLKCILLLDYIIQHCRKKLEDEERG